MRLLKRVAVLMVVTAAPPTLGAEQILCSRQSSSDVVITLNARRQFGRTLSCITGNFVADMTPCAPEGAFSLSAPTGATELVGVVDRWQEYLNHDGGVVSYVKSPEQIVFSGGFNWTYNDATVNQNRASVGLPPIPDGDKVPEGQGYEERWSFTVSRLTGRATLVQTKNPTLVYACNKAAQRF
jgi:hypothetical protein